jgi:hypothetical protein
MPAVAPRNCSRNGRRVWPGAVLGDAAGGSRWQRASLTLKPRSAYLLRRLSQTEWEHSIPGTDTLRYSVTFGSLASGRPR